MKKQTIIIFTSLIILIIIGLLYVIFTKESHLVKLNYDELIEKIDNKEDLVLCVSASECTHCQEYKPKLKKVAETYDITIFYVNIDEFTDEDYEIFKEKFSFYEGTPTTIFFKDGKEKTTATRIEGNVKTEKIISKLKNNGFINE